MKVTEENVDEFVKSKMPKQTKDDVISDVKIGSKDMKFWKNVIKARESEIEMAEQNIYYNQAIIEIAKKRYEDAEQEWQKLE